jgi:hypothetical protein
MYALKSEGAINAKLNIVFKIVSNSYLKNKKT